MASIKVKFRLSSLDPKMGTIYYQIIHNRVVRQYKTDYHIFVHEWDTQKGDIIILPDSRQHIVQDISERIIWDVKNLQSIFRRFDAKKISYTVDDIIKSFSRRSDLLSLSHFMQDVINQLHNMGKCRTAETYRATLRSFMLFRKNKDISMHSIDSDVMLMYEAYLHNRGLARNTTSFYMRILRAVYNRAVEKELIDNRNPFRHVYTGVDKTVKRAIPLGAIKQIKTINLSATPSREFARDMFKFSFYTRGMSFIDIAHLRKKNLSFGTLFYRRRKTGQQLNIRWEKCMQDIIDKYHTPHDSPYLLPILFPARESLTHYRNALCRINKHLKEIAKMIHLTTPLTLYVARHSWASEAKNQHIPISVISEAMGHDSELTTQIYLASLDTSLVDKANAQILKSLRSIDDS